MSSYLDEEEKVVEHVAVVSDEAKAMLLELADLLDSLPPGRFDYSHWVSSNWEGAEDLSCGTTACAAGWATTLPSFRAKGLQLYRFTRGTVAEVRQVDDDGFEHARAFEALANVLDIGLVDAYELFSPGETCSKLGLTSPAAEAEAIEVADWIREWVAAS